MDCLVQSCATTYVGADSLERRSMAKLFGDTSVLAPYVIATVVGPNGNVITVGNESVPKFDNHAVIKSFQYGRMDGVGCELEIVDEEGGNFKIFFDRIVNSFSEAAQKYQLKLEWGWVGTSCGNYPFKLSTTKPHTFLITKVNIRSGSVMTFMLEGTDLLQTIFEGRGEAPFGKDDAKMELKDAIRELLKTNVPPITDVQFLRRNPSGGPPTEWEFQGDTRNTYRADQQHALATIMRWIRPYVTTEGKGIIPAWDDTKDHPAIIFWEDASPPCNKLAEDNRRIGSYFVNGGNCSSVLSFTPEIKWSFVAAANTGGNVSTVNSENLKQQDINDCDVSEAGAGTATYNVIPDTAINSHGKEAGTVMNRNDKPHHRASRHFASYEPVQAELRIVGDPTLDDPINLYYATVGIVYINPIHLTKPHNYFGDGCANWTTVSTCNPILSNKQWYIQGWSHDIREGSYTTTLRLYLPPSGATQAKNEPLGANSSGEIIPTE